jgi:transcription antitermination factor NusG
MSWLGNEEDCGLMWHVLHVAPNSEAQVSKFLVLNEVESYVPRFPPPPRTKPGSVRARKLRWVFPGYVFFRIGDGFSHWDIIRWAPGVRRMLEEGGGPAGLGDDVIDYLRYRLAERQLRPFRTTFRRGQPVVIERGPLRMVDAIFEKNLGASERVQVLVQLLGRPLMVELDTACIRAAS